VKRACVPKIAALAFAAVRSQSSRAPFRPAKAPVPSSRMSVVIAPLPAAEHGSARPSRSDGKVPFSTALRWFIAQIAAWVRLPAPSLRSKARIWTLTVDSVMPRSQAISLLREPETRYRRILVLALGQGDTAVPMHAGQRRCLQRPVRGGNGAWRAADLGGQGGLVGRGEYRGRLVMMSNEVFSSSLRIRWHSSWPPGWLNGS